MLFITFSSENDQICHDIVNFQAAKTTESIRILEMLTFTKCQCFSKN